MPSPTPPSCTVHGLPAEVLLKIFRAYVDVRLATPHRGMIDRARSRSPLPITYVCRTWRAYAIGDPSLWNRIHVTANDGTLSKIAFLFLKRSSPVPVYVNVYVEGYGVWEGILGDLVKQKEVIQEKEVRFSDRIRGIHVRGLWSTDARKLISLLDEHELPSLSEFSIYPKDNETRYSESPFLPIIRPSLTRLELPNCSRDLDANSLEKIITSCPLLETLVLGRMRIDVSASSQLEETPGQSSRVLLAPKLKYLAVASPMTRTTGRRESCHPGCRCFFRDLVADSLKYVEVAGEVDDAILHLLPLISQIAATSGARKSGGTTSDRPPLTVVLNVGNSYLHQPEELLQSLPPNISLHLFDNSFKPDPAMELFFTKMWGASIYRENPYVGYGDDDYGSLDGRLKGPWKLESTFATSKGEDTVLTGRDEPPYLDADQDSDPEPGYADEDPYFEKWGSGDTDSEWDLYSSERSFDSEY